MSVYVVAQTRCAFAGPFLLPFAVLVLELWRLWLKCFCKEKSRTSSNGVLSHLRSESVPVHVYRNFEFFPVTFVMELKSYDKQSSKGYVCTRNVGSLQYRH